MLASDPQALLLAYQPIVTAIVSRFVSRGFFDVHEKEEVSQTINLLLLEKKLEKINAQYNGSVLLRTYFSRVVHNAVLELVRKQNRQPEVVDADSLLPQKDASLNPAEQMVIQDELNRLEALLAMLPKDRYKILLCLKLFARIRLTDTDLQFFQSSKTASAIAAWRAQFFSAYDRQSDKEVFRTGVALFNALDDKATDGDSLRRWTHQKADQLIQSLNGHPPVSRHTRESLKILLQFYFEG